MMIPTGSRGDKLMNKLSLAAILRNIFVPSVLQALVIFPLTNRLVQQHRRHKHRRMIDTATPIPNSCSFGATSSTFKSLCNSPSAWHDVRRWLVAVTRVGVVVCVYNMRGAPRAR